MRVREAQHDIAGTTSSAPTVLKTATMSVYVAVLWQWVRRRW